MMATKGMGSTVVLNVLLWLSLVISIPLSGFRPIYATVAIVGAVLLALMAALIIGLTRGAPRAGRILRAVGDKIPGVGGDAAGERSCSRRTSHCAGWPATGGS